MITENQVPFDVIPNIVSFCDPRTVVSMGTTCRAYYNYFKGRELSEAKTTIFNHEYGALASFETDISATVEKIKKLKNTDAYLTEHDGETNLSFFEKIKKRYEIFCGSPVKKAAEKMGVLFDEYRKIYSEFKKEISSDHPHPLQEHAHRCIRLLVIQEQEENLRKSFEKIKQTREKIPSEFSVFEKIAFSIISYFRQDNTNESDFVSQPICIHLLDDFVKREININKTKINIGNEIIPIKICCNFLGYRKSDWYVYKTGVLENTFGFSIRTDNADDRFLGRIRVEKSEKYKSLFIPNTDTSYLRQDRNTGDLPIDRCFVQMIIEIFAREQYKTLQIRAYDYSIFACAAGGMTGRIPFGSEENYFAQEITQDIAEARRAGKVFPIEGRIHSRDTHTEHEWLLWKSKKLLKDAGTQFIGVKDKQLIPALVDFDLHEPPTTWEKLIEKQPVLGNNKTPILPELSMKWIVQDC